MSSSGGTHWDRLVQALAEQAPPRRGDPLEPPERPEGTVGLSGEPLEYWERSRWLPSLASSIAGSVVGIHRRLPDLQYYGLDTGAVVDFVTSQSHQSVRRVHQTEEQLWLEFVDQIAQTRFDAVREYPCLLYTSPSPRDS